MELWQIFGLALFFIAIALTSHLILESLSEFIEEDIYYEHFKD